MMTLSNSFTLLLLVLAFLFSGSAVCRDLYPEHYKEVVYISGKIGNGQDDLSFSESEEGEPNFSSVFYIAPDGSIFIDDPVKKLVKRYTSSGKSTTAFTLGEFIVDDLIVLDSSLIAISYWNRPYIDLREYNGRVKDSIPMPGKVACQSALYSCGEGLYLSYCESGIGEPKLRCYHWSFTDDLLKEKVDSVGLWAETCGRYYATLQTFSGIEDTATIFSYAFRKPIRIGKSLTPVGIDGDGNLYVEWDMPIKKINGDEYRHWITKFSEFGEKLAEFEIKSSGTGHLIRVDKGGTVFTLDFDLWNKKCWRICRYSKH